MKLNLPEIRTNPKEDTSQALNCPYRSKINQVYIAVLVLIAIQGPQVIEYFGYLAGFSYIAFTVILAICLYFFIRGT